MKKLRNVRHYAYYKAPYKLTIIIITFITWNLLRLNHKQNFVPVHWMEALEHFQMVPNIGLTTKSKFL